MRLTGVNRIMGIGEGDFDGHAHVFQSDLPMVAGRRYSPSHDALPETFQTLLRGSHLKGALLVQPSFLGTDNSYLIETLKEARALSDLSFKGVAVLAADTPLSELQSLHSAGIVGIRLNMVGNSTGYDLADWRDLLRSVDKLGWHIEVHCEGQFLAPVLKGLTALCQTVVVDHFGLPSQASPQSCEGQRAILSAPDSQVLVKVSGPYRVFPSLSSSQAASACGPVFKRLIEKLGPDGLIWGSDWPWTRFEQRHSYEDTIGWRDNWAGSVSPGPLDKASVFDAP